MQILKLDFAGRHHFPYYRGVVLLDGSADIETGKIMNSSIIFALSHKYLKPLTTVCIPMQTSNHAEVKNIDRMEGSVRIEIIKQQSPTEAAKVQEKFYPRILVVSRAKREV